MRCYYCHNPELIDYTGVPLETAQVLDFLEKRKRFVDAVCISGGEPCIQHDLFEFASALKSRGFLIKLDTNGTLPHVLKRLIDSDLVDYIAMDVKAPIGSYSKISPTSTDEKAIENSIELLLSGCVEYEFRTTVCRPLLEPKEIIALTDCIKGAKRYYIQRYRSTGEIFCDIGKLMAYQEIELQEVRDLIKDKFGLCKVRG